MQSNHQDSLKSSSRLFHISEEPNIGLFVPRPSPSFFELITGDVVFAISDELLHNYLLPRDCPRVTWYLSDTTAEIDRERFMGKSKAANVIVIESGWYERIKETTLYCYEFPTEDFTLLDACADYYISYKPTAPIAITPITDIFGELLSRNIELRFTPSLIELAEEVGKSTLNFSIIRMRNARVG